MGKLYDYMDRWRTATPVIQAEGYAPSAFKGVEADPRDTEEITLESLIPRLEKLEAMIEGMKK